MSNWDYVITHYDIVTTVETNITNLVMGLPLFTDQGSGQINGAKIELESPLNEFIRTAPLIQEFDRIRITALDGFVGGSYDRVYDVKRIIPTESKSGGNRVTLILVGSEQHMQKINYSGTGYFTGTAETIEEIGNNYLFNRKALQPILTGHLVTDSENEAPTEDFQNNIYEYGINEDQGYNRAIETTDKLGSSVDDGGALDFYEVAIDTSPSDFTSIIMKVFSSGINGDVIIEDTEEVNQGEIEGGIDSITGTLICAWGAVDQGTLPTDHSRYSSREQRFPLQPTYNASVTYLINSRIQHLGVHYISIQNNNIGQTPASNPSFWTVKTAGDYFGNIIQYSPWTVDKVGSWKNSGCDVLGLGFGEGFFDGNLVVDDKEAGTFRTWTDIISLNPDTIDTDFLYGNSSSGEYRSLRVLCAGTGAGDFSGNDSNGVAFTNSVIQYNGKEWKVLYSAITDMLVDVIAEGRPYKFDGSWTLLLVTDLNSFDAFHPYDTITNVAGILSVDNGITDTPFGINQNSAVKVRYDYNLTSPFLDQLAEFYKIGGWLNLRFPYPISTKNAIGEDVGELYGGALQSGGVPDFDKEPAVLDLQNMKLTHDGFRGFTHGLSSEDFGQISALDFYMKLDLQSSNNVAGPFVTMRQANFNMRCLLYDTNDNVVFQDFILGFNNHWEPIHLPIGGFSAYRARRPLQNVLGAIIPPKAIEVLNIFEWRNVKQIVWQTQDSYDDQGRYSSLITNNPKVDKLIGGGKFPPTLDAFRRLELYIDDIRFMKPLLVNTGTPTDRSIEPDFLQKPDIGNYDQLKSDAFAELEKAGFPHIEYNITTRGAFDIIFGDSFWFRNIRMVPEEFESTDVPSGSNTGTIKLVAKKIEYSITDAKDGKGGFLRTIKGVRRFI